MEPFASAKRLILPGLALLIIAGAAIIIVNYWQQLARKPFGQLLRSDLPMLDLTVVMRDPSQPSANQDQPPENAKPDGDQQDKRCPPLTGGDTAAPTAISPWDKRPADCPRQALWYVNKRPIALTLYVNDGEKVLAWWNNDPQIQALKTSRFLQGLLFGLLKSMKIKAEQLHLDGLQGEFLGRLLADAIAADAELHYDLAHGRQGWVLSYRRGREFSEQALPALAGALADNGYRLAKLPEPIVEARIGLTHFWLTEYQRRVYLAQSLEALLNVIDSQEPEPRHSDAPLSLVLRGEALVEHLPRLLTGTASAPIEFSFELDQGRPGALLLPAGPWQAPLRQKLFAGVLASIPHDAFAAVAASYRLPANLTVDDWRRFAEQGPAPAPAGPEPGGLALVWDFDAANSGGVASVGVAIANAEQPAASPAYRQYLRNPELAAECAGGSVFLATSSQTLLTRMKEACEQQSLSALDWQRGADKQRLQDAQLVAIVNPGTALRELFLAGGASSNGSLGDFAARWQQQYEQAKAALREDGEKLFQSLPMFSYAGRADDGEPVRLEGKLLAQEPTP